MKKRRKRSKTVLTASLAALTLVLWLTGMAALTLGTTEHVFSELCEKGGGLAEYTATAGGIEYIMNDYIPPENRLNRFDNRLDYYMNNSISHAAVGISAGDYSSKANAQDYLSVYDDEYADCETAVLFLDREGSVVRESGDFIFFNFVTAEDWANGNEEVSASGWVNIGGEEDTRYSLFRVQYNGTKNLHDWHVLRITGYMDGKRIEPVSMALATDGYYYAALDRIKPGWDAAIDSSPEMSVSEDGRSASTSVSGVVIEPPYTAAQLDGMGFLEWDVRFDGTADADPALELVTVYAIYPDIFIYEPHGDVNYNGTERYDNLLELLKTQYAYTDGGLQFYNGNSQYRIDEMLIFDEYHIFDPSEIAAWDGTGDYPGSAYTMLTAMRASPLKISMGFLTRTYLVTLFIALVGFFIIRRSICKNLLDPLQTVNAHITEGWTLMPEYREHSPGWAETSELVDNYRDTADTLSLRRNEITRLSAALDYAKNAEQVRRRMTGNIAHELKTPIAVIYSYAEGLKEHIADDKRDKYLDVILSEVERMDGMVAEMLDLSRLEAGKVKLARDEFSLTELTRGIFEKLELAAAARELKIEYDFPKECLITADEARIAQVVENFATNAVKYTPIGGGIRIMVTQNSNDTTLAIENDGRPFSSEELAKVWDTFYRADEARSGGGTGLGLAIARSIVELHGGSCAVRNTGAGVEFSFTI